MQPNLLEKSAHATSKILAFPVTRSVQKMDIQRTEEEIIRCGGGVRYAGIGGLFGGFTKSIAIV